MSDGRIIDASAQEPTPTERAGTDTSVITFDGVSIGLKSKWSTIPLVHDVTLSLKCKEMLCIVGESGSGKSLTARSAIQLFASKALKITAGSILFDGQDLAAVSPVQMRTIRGRRIAMIFQEPMTALNPLMRVGQQVDEALRNHSDMTGLQRRARVLELFSEVRLPDPEAALSAYPHELSGGQRQRVMIAMALSLEPDILLADEPTTALDVTTQKQILHLMKELQTRHGTGIIFITHDFGVVAEIADRVAVMEKGRIVEVGTRQAVLEDPRHPYTRKLIAAIPKVDKLVAERPSTEVILSARDICKSYPVRRPGLLRKALPAQVLHNVTFDVRRGETFGIVGESGSGKTTIGRILTNLIPHDSGDVAFRGEVLDLTRKTAQRDFRRHVQIVFQDPFGSLNPRRKVGDLIASGPRAYGASRAEGWRIAREKLALVEMSPDAVDAYPHQFSGGQRQRIAIARALALEPSLIVADEATSALDVSVQAQILDLFQELKARLSLTLLFITHDLRVAAGICDSVAVMHNGRIIELGTAQEVFGAPRNEYTKQLIDAAPGKALTDRPPH